MLSQLTIQNFGLIDRLSLEFGEHLNIFTGETGAGKSILIEALHYALGGRLKTAQVRDPGESCLVEAVFELSEKHITESPVFSEYLTDGETAVIINRSYLPDGKTRNKVNGFSVTLTQLKKLGDRLVDFHGPHDHQLLLSEASHIGILDRLSDISGLKTDYALRYNTFMGLKKKLDDLSSLSESRERELNMLGHQIKELEQVSLEDPDYEELRHEVSRINNSEKLYECANRLISLFENGQSGINEAVSQAFSSMRTLNDVDEDTSDLAGILERIQDGSSELTSALNSYLDGLSFQPGEAEEVNRRCDIYNDLLRKYGPSLEKAREFHASAREKYDLLSDLEHNDADLRGRISECRKELDQIAKKITLQRKKTAGDLEKTIEKELKELGIKHVMFECRVEKAELNREGRDSVTFHISPNAGEGLKPLAEIVSSGEAARVMLALKKALTGVDPIPVLIFDEIDAQIGGRLGSITGGKLKGLSKDRQVILITHLPQIASFGDHHFKVAKKVRDSRTVTDVARLDAEDRVKELAKMMSGEKESKIAVEHAADMLSRAKR